MSNRANQPDFIGIADNSAADQDPLFSGSLTQAVLAATDPFTVPDLSEHSLTLTDGQLEGSGLSWETLDAAVDSLNTTGPTASTPIDTVLEAVPTTTLVDLDQLTGLYLAETESSLLSSFVQDNLPPLLGEAFRSDQLLVYQQEGSLDWQADLLVQANLTHETVLFPDLTWSADASTVRFTLQEDQAFSLALADLAPPPGEWDGFHLLQLDGSSESWLQIGQKRPDDRLAERLIIETLLRDSQGNLLSSEEINALAPGSLIQADLVVSDTRADGKGLIGLELNLQWDPAALTLQSVQVDPSLPLFRNTGSLDAAAGLLTGLAGAALPSSGTGSVLGDQRRDLFASLTFNAGSIGAEGLNLQLTPTKLPTSKNLPLNPVQVLAIGSDPALMPVIHGLASQTQVGEQQFLVEGLDAAGRRWQQQLSLTIQNVNDAPVALAMPPLTVQEEQPLQIDLSAFFRDDDLAVGDQLTYHLVDVNADWLQLNSATGLLSGQTDDPQVGQWTLTVEARDRSGATARQTLSLTIENVNDVPQWSGEELPAILLREQRNFQITLPAGLFSDADSGDSLRYSLDLQGQPDLAAWLTIDPITAVISGFAPAASDLPIHLKLIATDLAGASSSIDLALQVVDQTANRAPQWVGLPLEDRTIREGERISYDLSRLFRDADTLIGDQLRFEVEAPAWLNFDANSGLVTGLADNDAVGTVPISFRAVDLDGAEAVMRFWLTVENVNQAPERLAPAQQTRLLQTGSNFQLDLDTVFRDLDTIHGDWLTYTLQARSTSSLGVPDWLQWDPSTGELTLSPGADDRGLLSLRFSALDRSGLSNTYQLNLGIVADGGLVEVNQALQPLRLQPGESSVVNLADAFRLLRGADSVDYSVELLRRGNDGSLTPVDEADAGWVTLLDRRELPVQREEHITIEPVLRLLDSGELITTDDLAKLQAGTGIQLRIAVEDLRAASTLPGLIGLDLGLKWSGLTLDNNNPADLRQAISDLLPLFRQVDLSGLPQQKLRFSAASLPAMGLGQAVGDNPGESFLTLNFRLTDPSQPVRLDLTLNDESSGGLGLGLADGSNGDALLNLINLSSTPLPELHLNPSDEDLGNYALRVLATAFGGDAVSQLVALKVRTGANSAPEVLRTPSNLTFIDNRTQILPLDLLFKDPNDDPLEYQIRLSSDSQEDQRLLEKSIRLINGSSGPTLQLAFPGVTRPVRGNLTITGSDGNLETSQTINLLLNPRSQLVPIISNPHHPRVRAGDQVGLGDLFGAPALEFLDAADRTYLQIRSDSQLTVRLSNSYLQLTGINQDEANAIQNSWTTSESPQESISIPVSELTKRIGSDQGNFDLNWLEVLSPTQPSSLLKVELATSSHVSNDENGNAYGRSDTSWQEALLITLPSGAAPYNTPATERFLVSLLQRNGLINTPFGLRYSQASLQPSTALIAWNTEADFNAAISGELEDPSRIAAISVKSIVDLASINASKLADSVYQLMDIRVTSKNDAMFGGNLNQIGLPSDSQIQLPWDPLALSIGTMANPNGLTDIDPTRAGTQVMVELDVSLAGLQEDAFNAYRKYVSPETLAAASEQGLVLRDLDNNAITASGWYDFTQRRDSGGAPIGDGARFVVETISGDRRLTKILLTFTDNAFGDNNLSLGIIDDPGMPAKVLEADIFPTLPQPRLPLPPQQLQRPMMSEVNPLLRSENHEDLPTAPSSITPIDPRALPPAEPSSPDLPAEDRGRPDSPEYTIRGQHPSRDRGVGSSSSAGRGSVINGQDSSNEAGGPARHAGSQLSGAAAAGSDGGSGSGNGSGEGDQALMSRGSRASAGPGSHDETPSTDAETGGAAPLEQRGLHGGARGGADLPAALQNLFHQLVSMVGDESALVGLMLGMMVVPGGVERGLRSLLFDSRLGEGIQVQRRNLDLEAQWPVRLIQANGQPLPLELRLQNGRLQLLAATTDAEAAPTVDEPTSNGDQGGALWLLLGELNRPGEVIEQVQRRLEQLLNGNAESVQITWTHWLDQLSAQREERGNPSSQATLNQLRENVTMAQQIDPGMADALMAMELLDCHVRLGGQLPWLTAAEPALQA